MKHPSNQKRLTTYLLTVLFVFLAAHVAFAAGAQPATGDRDVLSTSRESLTFLVISDWGREGIGDTDKKTPGQLKVAHQLGMTARDVHAAFLVSCGDNFHGKGVPSSTDSLWQANFENVYADNALMIPWYIALGNHDYEGNVDAELAYAKSSNRWIQPARYFSFTKQLTDTSSALFVVLDSSPFVGEYLNDPSDAHHVKGQNTTAQVQWCDSVLRTSHANWKCVFFHHPAYSASTKHGSTPEMQKTFVPMFEKYHVDACFSGHDHDLQHSRPDNATVEYFGTGGGSETRPAGVAGFTKFSKASLGFAVVSITPHMLRVNFVNELGQQLYSHDITR